jgi:pimeloyl-ACP methyl ester carboxylesterase
MLWVTASAGAGPVSTQASGITWGDCSDPNLQAFHAQCGYLSVPLDYNHPNGAKIQLAVSRIVHTSSNYQGVILTNPGGPGGSGLGLNPFLIAQFQADGYGDAAGDYDWIGFDPRGVGSSIPSISCDPTYFGPDRPIYVPFTHQLLTTWLGRSQGYASDCASQSQAQTALLQNMTTVDSAKDMDSIGRGWGSSRSTTTGTPTGRTSARCTGRCSPPASAA